MGLTDIANAGGFLSKGLSTIVDFWWIGAILLVAVIVLSLAWFFTRIAEKKKEWTHKFNVKFADKYGRVTDERKVYLGKRAVFENDDKTFDVSLGKIAYELQVPLCGRYYLAVPGKYSSLDNSYNLVIDADNEIYLEDEIKFEKNKGMVLTTHSAVADLNRLEYRTLTKREVLLGKKLSWGQLLKFGLIGLGIICLMVVLIYAISKYSDAKDERIAKERIQAEATIKFAEAIPELVSVIKSSNELDKENIKLLNRIAEKV